MKDLLRVIYAVIKYGAIFRTESLLQFRTISPHLVQIHNECTFQNAFPTHTLLAAFKIETAFFKIKHQGFILLFVVFYFLSPGREDPKERPNRQLRGLQEMQPEHSHSTTNACSFPIPEHGGEMGWPLCWEGSSLPAAGFAGRDPQGACHFIAVLQQLCSCVTDMNCLLPLMRNREGKPTNILGFQSLSATWKLKKVLALVP